MLPSRKNAAAIAYAGRTCVCTSGSNTNLNSAFDRNTLGIDTVTAGTFSAADGETAAAGDGNEEIILRSMMKRIFGSMPEEYRVEGLEYRDLRWQCDCSEERLEKVLMTIGEKDLSQIIEEDGQAEMVCQFCRKKYLFDKEHLERILARVREI